jgi:hypothetical protein
MNIPPTSHRPPPPLCHCCHSLPPSAAISIVICQIMSSNDKVEDIVLWEALLKQSPVYWSAFDIFSSKAHKAPPMNTKHTTLLNIISRPWEEDFLRGSSQADDFTKLKKQCQPGWTSALNCAQVWTAPDMDTKLTPLLVLWDQLDSEKKIQASSCAGMSGSVPMNALKRAFKDLNGAYKKSLELYLETKCVEASKSVCLPKLDIS